METAAKGFKENSISIIINDTKNYEMIFELLKYNNFNWYYIFSYFEM